MKIFFQLDWAGSPSCSDFRRKGYYVFQKVFQVRTTHRATSKRIKDFFLFFGEFGQELFIGFFAHFPCHKVFFFNRINFLLDLIQDGFEFILPIFIGIIQTLSAEVNPVEKFKLVFKNILESLFIERMDQNEEFFARFMNEPDFQKFITEGLAEQSYNKIKVQKTYDPDIKVIQ